MLDKANKSVFSRPVFLRKQFDLTQSGPGSRDEPQRMSACLFMAGLQCHAKNVKNINRDRSINEFRI